MDKIKIISTVGPASMKKEIIQKMDQNGVDIFRINLSHTKLKDYNKIIEKIKSLVMAKCKSKRNFQKIFSIIDKDSSGTLDNKDFFLLIQKCVKGHDDVASKFTKQVFRIIWDDFCNNEGGVDCNAASEWIFS